MMLSRWEESNRRSDWRKLDFVRSNCLRDDRGDVEEAVVVVVGEDGVTRDERVEDKLLFELSSF